MEGATERTNNMAMPTPKCVELTAAGWEDFKFDWHHYEIATGIDKKPDEVRVSTFLTVAGLEAKKVYKTFKWENDGDKNVLATVLQQFESYCMPKKSVVFDRYEFGARKKEPTETVRQYIAALRELAKTCEFEKMSPNTIVDELIRDKVIFAVSAQIRNALRREPQETLTLDKVITIVQGFEKAAEEEKKISADKPTTSQTQIDTTLAASALQNRFKRKPFIKHKGKNVFSNKCGRCGNYKHKKAQCPAINSQCMKCHKFGHWSAMCKLDSTTNKSWNATTLQESTQEDYFVSTVNCIQRKFAATKDLKIGNDFVRFLVDTGSDVNTLPMWIYKQTTDDLKLYNVQKHNKSVTCYNGQSVQTIGNVSLQCYDQAGKTHRLDFLLLEEPVDPLIGIRSAVNMELVKLNDVEKPSCMTVDTKGEHLPKFTDKESVRAMYPDVFAETPGDIGITHHISIDPNAIPVHHKQRRIQEPLRQKVKDELDLMEKQGIIKQVTEPTDWLNSIVIVPKPNNKIRICLDCQELNNAIKRENYTMPTFEEVSSRLAGAKVFTKLDAKHGFHQIRLDEESSYLTTFSTPFGRYRYLRLPFGLNSSSEVFQRAICQVLEDLDRVFVIADDILTAGSEDDHDQHLHALLKRCQERNLRLNFEKLELRQKSVKYMGHILTENGIVADPNKVQGIVEMPSPENVSQVRTFLCTVNFLSKFLPQLATIAKPLHNLLCKNVEFIWSPNCEQAFNKIKKLITETPILAYFDVSKPVVIQCDASQCGLGAALIQEDHPISLRSRSLTPTEERYAQIEKEMLAIVNACEKFDHYIFGLPEVIVESDHKPLQAIFQKAISDVPRRLQRMRLRLQNYNLKVCYKPGKNMWIADLLSRLFPQTPQGQSTFSLEVENTKLNGEMAITQKKLQQLQRATENDPVLANYIKTNKVPSEYKSVESQMSNKQGLVFMSERLVIPMSMRKETLNALHAGHKGIGSTRRLAQESVYWPGISSEIKKLVGNCRICASIQPTQPKEPMQPHDIASGPWQKIGMDYFELEGKPYLVMVDYYSNWIEIDPVSSLSVTTLINICRKHFCRHGIPLIVMSDSASQFKSQQFQQFADKWDFQLATSSPFHQQSNGKAESAVKIAKTILKKCKLDGSDPNLALLEWRNTPLEYINASPAQLMFNRRTRSIIPVLQTKLDGAIPSNIKKGKEKRISKQSRYYNRHTKMLSPIKRGEIVGIQIPGSTRWIPGTVIDVLPNRKYKVEVDDAAYIRNRKFIRRSKPIPMHTTSDADYPIIAPVPPEEYRSSSRSNNSPNLRNNMSSNELPIRRSSRPHRQPQRYIENY